MIDSHSPVSKRTIVVVDDNPDLVTIVKIILEVKGFGVQTAHNGKKGFGTNHR